MSQSIFVAVPPNIDLFRSPELFQMLQLPGNKLVDLSTVPGLSVTLVEDIAASWQAPRGTVQRIALVVPFDAWAVMRQVARAEITRLPLADVELGLFYSEQHRRGHAQSWLDGGPYAHALELVIDRMWRSWSPPASWPITLDALAELSFDAVDASASAVRLADIARVADAIEPGGKKALELASSARAMLPRVAETVAHCQVMTAFALVHSHADSAGATELFRAIAETCRKLGAVVERARALYGLAGQLRIAGHLADAEVTIREAIPLLSSDHPTEVAMVHQELGEILVAQGRRAEAALAVKLARGMG